MLDNNIFTFWKWRPLRFLAFKSYIYSDDRAFQPILFVNVMRPNNKWEPLRMNPSAFSRPDIMVVESGDPARLAIVTRIYY